MALAVQQDKKVIKTTKSFITATTYDSVAVDHLMQMYFRTSLRARRNRTADTTKVTGRNLKNHLIPSQY